jgi:hypothetical protein
MEKKEEIKKEIKKVKYTLYALFILAFIIIFLIYPSISFCYKASEHTCYLKRDSIYNNLAYLSEKYSTMKAYLNLKFGYDIPQPILDFMNEYEFRKTSIDDNLKILTDINDTLRLYSINLLSFTIWIVIGLIYLLYKIRKIEKRI